MDLNIPLLLAFGAGLVILIGFLIYRNLKDEEEYEKGVDDPHQLKKNISKDDLEKRK